ncbi:hypothetical protein RD792_000204 [Penstemon davidsonii]|uniref:Uncharacterized protein n=1 Tax=Penstemon davidsonii TaxID=160366 RepID=A0ABR0DUH0_9LAMI|nr:hypothetical protein RD792_000204 [Penstemon davidsonii]
MPLAIFSGDQYDATDFGWGKPIWASVGYGYVDFHLHNFLLLMDRRFGNGVEAWLTLSEEEMDVVEKDPELLAFASLNPCPLRNINDDD